MLATGLLPLSSWFIPFTLCSARLGLGFWKLFPKLVCQSTKLQATSLPASPASWPQQRGVEGRRKGEVASFLCTAEPVHSAQAWRFVPTAAVGSDISPSSFQRPQSLPHGCQDRWAVSHPQVWAPPLWGPPVGSLWSLLPVLLTPNSSPQSALLLS